MSCPEKPACDAAKRLSSAVRKLPISRSGDKITFTEKKLMDPKFHPIYLEMRNAGIELAEAFEQIGETKQSSDAISVFPKTFTSYLLDSRYSIFCYHSLVPDLPPYPQDTQCIPGTVCVVTCEDGSFFLGLITHEIEPSIFRVFDLSKQFEFTYCCLHQVALFPIGAREGGIDAAEGEDVYFLQVARQRLEHRVLSATYLQEVSPTECDLFISGTKVRAMNQYVARKGLFPVDDHALVRLKELEPVLPRDPQTCLEVREKPQARRKVKREESPRPDTAAEEKKEPEVFDIIKAEAIVQNVRGEEKA